MARTGGSHQPHKLLEVFDRFRKAEWHKSVVKGFNTSELKVLFYIYQGCCHDSRGIPVSSISNMMEVTSPTVTPLVKSLEKRGMLTREHDEEDRRIVRIKLTEKGEEVSNQAIEEFNRKFAGLHEFLGEEKSDQLADLLNQVYVYLEQDSKKDCSKNGVEER